MRFLGFIFGISKPARRLGAGTRASERTLLENELVLPILFYVLTICSWQTQFADLLFVLPAWVFVVLGVLGVVGVGHADRPAGRNALLVGSAFVLAIMWLIYALRLLLGLR